MTSLDYRLNPLFTIKECSSCGSLYNKGYCCTPDSSQQPLRDCPKCGNPVEGPNCQGCAVWRKKLKEVWFTICHENGIYQDLLNTYESSDDDTNVVSVPQEPFTLPSVHPTCNHEDENSFTYDSKPNSFNDSPSVLTHPPQLQFETYLYELCGNNAYYGYDCPPQFPLFSRIPFRVTPKVILIAWESFGEIKDALMDKQYRQKDIQELMSKLLEDVQNISEEFLEYINCLIWNRPLFYFDDDDDEYTVIWRRPKAITPDEPFEEPEDPLIMGEKELSTIPEKDKSNIPITSPKIDFLSEEFVGEFAPILPGMDEDEFDEEEVDCYDHDISSDDDSYENIKYFESFNFDLDPSFPRPPSEPPDVEISLIIETDAPVINNFDDLNEDECFDPRRGEINVEVDDSFTFVTRTFLPFLTYPKVSPLLSPTRNEDTIFDLGIST
ncbi:hypothetical protein Tco_0511143 [Tanacetum coccineum]